MALVKKIRDFFVWTSGATLVSVLLTIPQTSLTFVINTIAVTFLSRMVAETLIYVIETENFVICEKFCDFLRHFSKICENILM